MGRIKGSKNKKTILKEQEKKEVVEVSKEEALNQIKEELPAV